MKMVKMLRRVKRVKRVNKKKRETQRIETEHHVPVKIFHGNMNPTKQKNEEMF